MIPEVEAALQRVLARVRTSALVRDDRAELRCATRDEVELAAEVRRLRDLLPNFARLPSFAAWVEDAKITEAEVKRLRAGVVQPEELLRLHEENTALRAEIAGVKTAADAYQRNAITELQQLRVELSETVRVRDELVVAHSKSRHEVQQLRETIRAMSENEGKLHLRIAQLETLLADI